MAGNGVWTALKNLLNVSVGSTDGLGSAIKAEIGSVANSLAKNSSLKTFNGLNFTTNQEINYNLNGVAKKIAKDARVSASSFDEMQAILNETGDLLAADPVLKSGNLIKDKAGNITAASQKAVNDTISAFDNVRQNAAADHYTNYGNDMSALMADDDLLKITGRTGKKNLGSQFITSGYFGDETYGATRKKAALGAYAAGAIGTRFLSGGDLTHNSRGENDIAGIPFF